MSIGKIAVYLAGASVCALAAPVQAQNTPDSTATAPTAPMSGSTSAPENGQAEATEIVVTGSRLSNTGFAAPTPVTVVGAAEISREGATSISDVLNQVPSFRAQNTPATNATTGGNLGVSTAELRGLGSNRTLVLIDSRRVVAATVPGGTASPANAVDLGMIPVSIIQRAEVVTGGASAQYGSGAVAGVVNVILNTKLEGFRGSVQYCQTNFNDAKDYAASIAWGAKVGDRGH